MTVRLACFARGQGDRVSWGRLSAGPICSTFGARPMKDTRIQFPLDAFRRGDTFDDIPLAMDFRAAWCGPCRMTGPGFANATKARKGCVQPANLHADAISQAGAHYGIRDIALLIAFRGGREIGRRGGVTPANDIVGRVGARSQV